MGKDLFNLDTYEEHYYWVHSGGSPSKYLLLIHIFSAEMLMPLKVSRGRSHLC